MINYLQDCSQSTLIGSLPDIINHNNESVREEFNWIYDSSMNRLTKSVYAPTGSVKAHFGEFVNLACEYITIKNVDSLKPTLQKCVDEIVADDISDHNLLNGRWSSDDIEQQYENSEYCHDAAAIVYENGRTVADEIRDLKDGNVALSYNGNIYTGEDIAALIDWKSSIEEKEVILDTTDGETITCKVLCVK